MLTLTAVLNVTDSAWFVYLFGQNCWFTIYPKGRPIRKVMGRVGNF